uniref:Zf-primase domain-containing protein n=1 Tax=Bursaphelenchus xylophilus TaxID=6326 RepID=A0A1I7SFB2_BURXY
MDFAVIGTDKQVVKGAYDPFFNIKINNPKVSLEVFNVYCGSLKKIKLRALTANVEDPNFVTMGVVVQSSGTMKSAKNSEYVIWTLDDLMDDRKIKILLFGEAATAHWKIQTGFTVALTHLQPATSDSQQKNSMLTFKVVKDIQVVALGFCPDYGICQGMKKDGGRCTNYVNISITPNCDFHIQQAAKKFRSQRGAFSAISNERPKCATPREPRPFISQREDYGDVKVVKLDQPCTSKATMRPGDRALIASRARLGQRALTALAENQAKAVKEEEKDRKPEPASMKAFLAVKTKEERLKKAILKAGTPQLGRNTQRGTIADLTSPQKPILTKRPLPQKESAARLKAAAIFKKSLEKTGKVDGRTAQKRKADNEEDTPLAKKQNLLTSTEKQSGRKNQKVVGQKVDSSERC